MGKNYFTEEQQKILRENPYIKRVSEKAITYTKEFKERFSEEYFSGKLPSQILIDMGIDYHLLGQCRTDSIAKRMKAYNLRAEGCKDTRKGGSGRPLTKNLTPEEKIKRLEQKVAYLNQENEFLKKNIQMNKQAGWEYKRLHPSNTNSSKT